MMHKKDSQNYFKMVGSYCTEDRESAIIYRREDEVIYDIWCRTKKSS